ncbi:MAG: glycerol-3-phosphate 1-O-acyltransferase PlsY [Chloroflexia bacterium]
MQWLELILLIIGSYLMGSIPSGLVIGLSRGQDLREHGSGKTGATNTLRVIGRRAAAAVFVLDLAKGAIPVLVARALPWPNDAWVGMAMGCAAIAAVVGHIWSIWIRLFTGKWGGGRGVATVFGAMLMVYPLAAVLGLVAGIGVIAVSRYVSLGSIIGVSVGILMLLLFVLLQQIPLGFLPLGLATGLLVVAGHHDNIQRLLKGTERKIGGHVET